MHDGQRVSYIGLSAEGLELGDQGQVVVTDSHSAHVRWVTGSLTGQMTLTDNFDLAPVGRHQAVSAVSDDLDDSLDVHNPHTAAYEVYQDQGEVGLLNYMADNGHLGAFQNIAEEAHAFIMARLRQEPSFRAIATQLDDDESEGLVRLAASVLLRDAFGDPE